MTSLRRFVASQRKSAGTNVGKRCGLNRVPVCCRGCCWSAPFATPLQHLTEPSPSPALNLHHITSHDQSLKGIYMPNRAHTPTSHRGGATQPHRRRSSSHSAPHPPPPPFRPTPALRSPHGPPSSRTRRLAKSGGAGTSLVPCRQFARSLSP